MCTKWGVCKPVPAPAVNNGPEILNDVKNGNTMAICPSPSNLSPRVEDVNGFKEDTSETSSKNEKVSSSQKMHRWIRMSKLANLLSKSSSSFSRIESRSQNENRPKIYALSDRTFASSLNEFAADVNSKEDGATENGISLKCEENNIFPLNFSKRSISLNDLQSEGNKSSNTGK